MKAYFAQYRRTAYQYKGYASIEHTVKARYVHCWVLRYQAESLQRLEEDLFSRQHDLSIIVQRVVAGYDIMLTDTLCQQLGSIIRYAQCKPRVYLPARTFLRRLLKEVYQATR